MPDCRQETSVAENSSVVGNFSYSMKTRSKSQMESYDTQKRITTETMTARLADPEYETVRAVFY